jgi:hypothetical protein
LTIDLEPGARITRAELNARYGGGIQGGMLTPAGGKLIFLFSDPVSGETYGYTTDGWADEERTRYSYTGEGPSGPQAIDRGKNKILLETLETGREAHLFYAVGTVPGTQERIHEYLGQFVVDAANPWQPATTLGQDKQPRTVVLFNLIRVDGGYARATTSQVQASPPAAKTTATTVDREAADVTSFERAAVDPVVAERRERLLEDRLIKWLADRGLTAKRYRIRIAGERGSLFTDTWIPETHTLLEVKGDATRNDVRMGVAQLLDYRRHISPEPARSAVVVPLEPSIDLQDYVRSAGLSLAVFDSRGLTYLVEQ